MVKNVHRRILPLAMPEAEALLRGLASHEDRMWPGDLWWPQRFEGGLVVGAKGGHGPVRYKVESVGPREVVYRFPQQSWFCGTHRFELRELPNRPGQTPQVELVHTLKGRVDGVGILLWPLAVRWLHDALLEDVMDRAQSAAGQRPLHPAHHSWWVRYLRQRWLKLPSVTAGQSA